MTQMTKCTDLIMEDAKKKKNEWTQRLSRYEVESLLSLRDTLLARGSMLTMTSADIKEIIRKIKSTLDNDTRDRREAAMKGFKMGVDEITQKMERYTDELKHNEGRLGEMTHNLNVVNTRLKQVDERLRQLRPGMRLDSLEDRYPIETVQAQQPVYQHKKIGFKTVTVYKDQVAGKAAANSSSCSADSMRLNERDHHTKLLDQLKLHATKWRNIGTYLEFQQGELDIIESKPMLLVQGPLGYLNEMLSVWYQWAPGDGRGSQDFATLEALKNALRQAGLGRAANDLSLK